MMTVRRIDTLVSKLIAGLDCLARQGLATRHVYDELRRIGVQWNVAGYQITITKAK